MKIDPKAAFLHVIDAHRWLAASGCAWNLVGANAANETKKKAHELLPNIDVMIRDCLLLHARSLSKFYRNVGQDTDITLSAFDNLAIDPSLDLILQDYENSIEVHLFHLTEWRDSDYRNLYAKGPKAKKCRRDWNSDSTLLVELLIECLKYTSQQSGRWQLPFKDLYYASVARYQDKLYIWPKKLCEKSDVRTYLKNLGL